MKERPILSSGPMVKAILDGQKTQTRRILEPGYNWHPTGELGRITSSHPMKGKFGAFIKNTTRPEFPVTDLVPCKYGQPGDRLWLKETFLDHALPGYPPVWFYRADGDDKPEDRVWRPSIFMPRAASRITLEITGIRVERLQDISEEDAKAEGAARCFMDRTHPDFENGKLHSHREDFELIWKSINGADSWAANPWVWVLNFRRVEK